jgi:hypothetical protein
MQRLSSIAADCKEGPTSSGDVPAIAKSSEREDGAGSGSSLLRIDRRASGGIPEPIALPQESSGSHFATIGWIEREDCNASFYIITMTRNDVGGSHDEAMFCVVL